MLTGLVVMGASLGGLSALSVVLGGLPPAFPWPVIIVQHRHKDTDGTLPALLQRECRLPLTDAYDKAAIRPGEVLLAPPDYHILVEHGWLAMSTEGPVAYARPAIDVLFESAAASYGPLVVGVVLTGANSDGARGLAAIKAQGGRAIVQDPSSAVCAVMPQAALALVAADFTLPLAAIAPCLVDLAAADVLPARGH